ncbi:MAG: PLDc N-terminal domain-containing protein, partial [Burkholderiales bacterium]|nr:PLDc N-terminal domain-containing protein [Burkholderiales bacterium]
MRSGLPLTFWLTIHGLATALAVLVYVITAHVLQQRRHPTAAIAWVLFILLLPYLALPAFLTFGSRKQARPRSRPPYAPDPSGAEGPWAVQTALALGQPAPAPYRDLHLHADGREALAALWHAIEDAEHSIDLCTFIIGRDAVGHGLIEQLCAKARAGVQVRVLLDGLGSLMRSRPDLRPLRAAGVQLTMFVPPLHSPLKGRTNLRDHRKMLIKDAGFESRRLWCGGRNLAGEYFEGEPGRPPWHDLSFDLGGAFVQQASALFEHDWAFANGLPPQTDAP